MGTSRFTDSFGKYLALMNFRLFQAVRFQWVAPFLVLVAGCINLINSELSNTLKIIWLCMFPIVIILLVVGIINHRKFAVANKDSK
jgi:cytochrome c-type biogenesis protein CcmH/NrfF